MLKVITFGEILWDIFPDQRRLGGAPANFAYRLHSLGCESHLISRIGSDELGQAIQKELRATSLPQTYLQQDTLLPTGTVMVELEGDGAPHYEITPNVAYDEIKLSSDIIDLVPQAKVICFGTLIQRSAVSRQTLSRLLALDTDAIKVVDINLRPECFDSETIRFSLAHSNVVKMSLGEVQLIRSLLQIKATTLRDVANFLVTNYNLFELVVTNGEEGVVVFCNNGTSIAIPGYQVQVQDAVGAGDSFLAGYVKKRMEGCSVDSSCEFGCLIGALVASKEGGMPRVTPEELQAFSLTATRTTMAVFEAKMDNEL